MSLCPQSQQQPVAELGPSPSPLALLQLPPSETILPPRASPAPCTSGDPGRGVWPCPRSLPPSPGQWPQRQGALLPEGFHLKATFPVLILPMCQVAGKCFFPASLPKALNRAFVMGPASPPRSRPQSRGDTARLRPVRALSEGRDPSVSSACTTLAALFPFLRPN